MESDGIKVPETLEEAFEILESFEGSIEFKTKPEKTATGELHFWLGRWIRNNWGLWSGEGKLYEWFADQGIKHADDMSGVILTSFHRHMNNKPLDIEDQIQKYKEYWRQLETDTA